MRKSLRYALGLISAAVLLAGAVGLYLQGRPAPEIGSRHAGDADRGCGKARLVDERPVPLSSLGIKTPIYALGMDGKLYRFDPATKRRKLLADHGFEGPSGMYRLPGGRWIGYAGELNGVEKEQYWLFDTVNGVDQMILEYSGVSGETPALSPDGTMLALIATSHDHGADGIAPGIQVLDIASMRSIPINLPSSFSIDHDKLNMNWSADGRQLLIDYEGAVATGFRRQYFSWTAKQRQLEKINGEFDRKTGARHFFRNGAEIFPASQVRVVSDEGKRELVSPDGKWRAAFGKPAPDTSYSIEVTDGGGTIKRVGMGRYSNCLGETLWITGWIDDRHLVYSDQRLKTYVFDAVAGGSAALFDEHDDVREFSW